MNNVLSKELNIDGLVGPTHNYAALAYGNLASAKHKHQLANPKAAALEGLAKMKCLMALGCPQAVLPPPLRPDMPVLRQLGFAGTDTQVLQQAHKQAPDLLAACSSASSMWVANAATVSPSRDSIDARVHITPANLTTFFHRAIEVPFKAALFQKIFSDSRYFVHHAPLPSTQRFSDEGAANHHRFVTDEDESGLQLFVYNHQGSAQNENLPARFPARQSVMASQSIARLHQLAPEKTLFAQQSPAATDAGVFHNDVIATAHRNVFLFHEAAFVSTDKVIDALRQKWGNLPLYCIKVNEKQISFEEAVSRYFFNSQLVSLEDGNMALIAPHTCHASKAVMRCIEMIIASDNPIQEIHYVNCSQSMQNGGGPACLRLRVVLTAEELAAVHPGVFLTETRYQSLVKWVEQYYRDRVLPDDLRDPQLLEESRSALSALATILDLESLY